MTSVEHSCSQLISTILENLLNSATQSIIESYMSICLRGVRFRLLVLDKRMPEVVHLTVLPRLYAKIDVLSEDVKQSIQLALNVEKQTSLREIRQNFRQKTCLKTQINFYIKELGESSLTQLTNS